MINNERLAIANKIMPLLLPTSELMVKNGHVDNACWEQSSKHYQRHWRVNYTGSFFPCFRLPTGGTHITAIAQLVNWVRDRPVLPIQTWHYWFTIGMRHSEQILPLLEKSDYPKEKKCQWCGSQGKLDWYSFGKYSGLGCYSGCEPLNASIAKHREKSMSRV